MSTYPCNAVSSIGSIGSLVSERIIMPQLFTIKFSHREPKLAQVSERGGDWALGWLVLVKKVFMK